MKLISFYEDAQQFKGRLWLRPHTLQKTKEVVKWVNSISSNVTAEYDTMITGFNLADSVPIIKLTHKNGHQTLHSINDMVFQFNTLDINKPNIIRYDCNKEFHQHYGPTYYEQINHDTFASFRHKHTHNLFKIENNEDLIELIQFLNTKNEGQHLSDKIKDGIFNQLFNEDYFILQDNRQINCFKLPVYIELEYFYNDNSMGDLKIHNDKALEQLNYNPNNEIKSSDYFDRLLKPDEEALEKYKVININHDTIEFNSNLYLISDDFKDQLNRLIFIYDCKMINSDNQFSIHIKYENHCELIKQLEELCDNFNIKLNKVNKCKSDNITTINHLNHSVLNTVRDTINQTNSCNMNGADVYYQYKYLIQFYIQNLEILKISQCSNDELIELANQCISFLKEPIKYNLYNINNNEYAIGKINSELDKFENYIKTL